MKWTNSISHVYNLLTKLFGLLLIESPLDNPKEIKWSSNSTNTRFSTTDFWAKIYWQLIKDLKLRSRYITSTYSIIQQQKPGETIEEKISCFCPTLMSFGTFFILDFHDNNRIYLRIHGCTRDLTLPHYTYAFIQMCLQFIFVFS